VFLLWDSANRKIALKAAAKNDRNAFTVSMGRDSYSGSLRAKSFFDHIGLTVPKRTTLPAFWNEREKMLEITLPKDLVGSLEGHGKRQRFKLI
jgi:hypothetical protein